MTLHIPFDNSYVRLPDRLYARQMPTPVRAPQLIAYNQPLGATLGITGTEDEAQLAKVFAGNVLPDGAEPLAQLYAGHQFGNWNPQLGDGRAVLLGESRGYDIQLKGSGPTPFSRRGDGRAWLGPVLREYIMSEAMHALGVPTTRALAAVTTGEEVIRERPLPGAVLTRVASSHLRVGTFQVLAARQDKEGLAALLEFAIARHYPKATGAADFLKAVIQSQAELVAHWMALGFIHGVMNTDNATISGETIDYGPCAFMDTFHPGQVFSSIDRDGRYAYGNQPDIAVWNMAQLATALLPLEDNSDAAVAEFTDLVNAMPDVIRSAWRARFGAKLGLTEADEQDEALIIEFLTILSEQKADFTNGFRSLSRTPESSEMLIPHKGFASWHTKWQARLTDGEDAVAQHMAAANPARIPRNHQVEAMIAAAVAGDFAPFHQLARALADPYQEDPQYQSYCLPPRPEERVTQTFCGT
ncbi:YdiU family protein [Shimia sp. R11_0]|uniref:protein adenylyltransferase SelO n=1 Tax=Shimia sp. R11_0 TaxID=2821096 RepID=UPI001AD99270|nr:YdiU family protein [Shimia sp. R11_0]MBO9477058.1 YdiU family protein [Shimia sp. R11_0]